MFNSRYSAGEYQQWQDACADGMASELDAHAKPSRASMAKGQAEPKTSRTATAKTQSQKPGLQDWASECLFDCYNG
jgi:hypothetical protein